MNDNSWMSHPALGSIDPAKLQMLSSIAEQAQGKNQQDLLPFLMNIAGGGSMQNIPPNTPLENKVSGKTPANPSAPDAKTASISSGATSGSTDTPDNASETAGMSFDPSEAEAIINVLKSGKSPQEIQKIDRILSIMKRIKK